MQGVGALYVLLEWVRVTGQASEQLQGRGAKRMVAVAFFTHCLQVVVVVVVFVGFIHA